MKIIQQYRKFIEMCDKRDFNNAEKLKKYYCKCKQ